MLIKTGAMRMQETVALSQEVKEFEKTLGIEPSACLSKSAFERPGYYIYRIWLQKRGTLALDTPIDMQISLEVTPNKNSEPLRVKTVWPHAEEYSAYGRVLSAVACNDTVIMPSFARRARTNKVEVIIHEDLHMNDEMASEHNIEAFVMPLGFLAALEFFKEKEDARAMRLMQQKIYRYRKLSRDIMAFAQKLRQIFKTVPLREAYYRASYYMPSLYKHTSRKRIKAQSWNNALEAMASHDLLYFKCFDDVIALSEKVGDFKTLLKIIETAPDEYAAIQRHFKKAGKKYQSPAQ